LVCGLVSLRAFSSLFELVWPCTSSQAICQKSDVNSSRRSFFYTIPPPVGVPSPLRRHFLSVPPDDGNGIDQLLEDFISISSLTNLRLQFDIRDCSALESELLSLFPTEGFLKLWHSAGVSEVGASA
jgi:hypothetical protein